MKLKSALVFTLVFLTSVSIFGQKTEPAKTPPSKSDGVKTAQTSKLPTVNEVLDKYVAALGGRAANEKFKTRVTKASLEFMPMGIKGTTETYVAAPDKSYSKMNMQGIGEIVTATDGKSGWTINPLQGNRDITGEELLQLKLANNLYRETNLDKIYSNLTVKGIEKVGGKDAYIVTGTPAGLAPETFYFDAQTGLLVRSDSTLVSPEGKMPAQVFYEDFRDVDGVKIPYKMRVVIPQAEIVTTITEIKNGAAIDDSKFAKPKE
jgi:hypothetical protein